MSSPLHRRLWYRVRPAAPRPSIGGFVKPGFEPVREAFEANFVRQREVGASFAVHHRGELVVDLWGGTADPHTGRPWARDTPMVVFSATKGMAALRMLQLAEQGRFDPDEPVASYWPAFGQHGKDAITGRMILNHRAGLSAIDEPLTLADFDGDHRKVRRGMEAMRPMWTPGSAQGYAACSYGAFVGELHRRVTGGQSIGAGFAESVAEPLGLDTWIGAPDEVIGRAARLIPAGRSTLLTRQLPSVLARRTNEAKLFRRILRKGSDTRRAFENPHMEGRFEAMNDPANLRLELPWMGALTTARSLSRMYAAVVGEVDGVRLVSPASVEAIAQRQSFQGSDNIIVKSIGWSQGFVKEEDGMFSPTPRAFGHPGAGGALGWADPDRQLGIGYTMNRMDWRIRSPRSIALCEAVYASLA